MSVEFMKWTLIVAFVGTIFAFQLMKKVEPGNDLGFTFGQISIFSWLGILITHGTMYEIAIGKPLLVCVIAFGLPALVLLTVLKTKKLTV